MKEKNSVFARERIKMVSQNIEYFVLYVKVSQLLQMTPVSV